MLFDDPNRISDVEERLYANHQRNKAFSAWIAKMKLDAAIAGFGKCKGPQQDIILLNLSPKLK